MAAATAISVEGERRVARLLRRQHLPVPSAAGVVDIEKHLAANIWYDIKRIIGDVT